ncbi:MULTISPECIES: hypothetical protein [unclassified Moorena]|uniref:hypothetical protein n=1 Tax=unclassified Moorena TaxID=2683338 RepID=UPI0014016BE0|nr:MULTISPECIES: hypothetical protein [unclassified Moorena]NEO17203.1 hypothetical protein [Moorena sp. SIO3E8]NEQ03747.1 hypothetical protein [Moorena sp. SIO3F7]
MRNWKNGIVKERDAVERSQYQILWLLAKGKQTEEVREATGYSAALDTGDCQALQPTGGSRGR